MKIRKMKIHIHCINISQYFIDKYIINICTYQFPTEKKLIKHRLHRYKTIMTIIRVKIFRGIEGTVYLLKQSDTHFALYYIKKTAWPIRQRWFLSRKYLTFVFNNNKSISRYWFMWQPIVQNTLFLPIQSTHDISAK